MDKSEISDGYVREYLLGRVSDETVLEAIEDQLFGDDTFCSHVALVEDDLINDYVCGRLNAADAESFRATLTSDRERRSKVELAEALRARALARDAKNAAARPSLFASLSTFFRQPKYAGAFAVILIAALALIVFLARKSAPPDLAELQSLYRQARPTEARITEFDYAPLTQLRGEPEPAEKTRLRRIENTLIVDTEKNPSAQTHHALGVFNLTQRKYSDAIEQFDVALRFDGHDAQIHNNLGVAYFERAKTDPQKRLEDLSHSLEEFKQATKLNENLLEALFNKSLALQEWGMSGEAKDSWNLYLQKDASSPWADEARKHLSSLENKQTLFKSEERVLSDFLTAYRTHDFTRAQTIHNETKGLLKTPALALQLSQRYLIARQRGDNTEAAESLAAMTFIGDFEREQSSEFFFLI
jgi:hypothetical protein